jgi:hypothetical protein
MHFKDEGPRLTGGSGGSSNGKNSSESNDDPSSKASIPSLSDDPEGAEPSNSTQDPSVVATSASFPSSSSTFVEEGSIQVRTQFLIKRRNYKIK